MSSIGSLSHDASHIPMSSPHPSISAHVETAMDPLNDPNIYNGHTQNVNPALADS